MNAVKKVEERIEKREKRIEKLQSDLREEKSKLKSDQEILVHLKYDDVLKHIHEKGVSPDDALRALQTIENEVTEQQLKREREGEQSHETRY